MNVNEHAKDAIARAKRSMSQSGGKPPAKPPAPTPEPEVEKDAPQCVILPEKVASQIGEANFRKGDVLLYVKPAFMTPTAVKNIIARGPGSLEAHVAKQDGYFIIARESDIAEVLKRLVKSAIKEARK